MHGGQLAGHGRGFLQRRRNKGAALNEHGYHVWQVERNLYAVTDNVYMSAFLTTPDGVVIFDAPPNIGHNIRRAVDEITAANGLTATRRTPTWLTPFLLT